MKIIDARKQACPLPIIRAKEAMETQTCIQIIVDNEIAKENLEKLAKQKNYTFSFNKNNDNLYEIVLSKNDTCSIIEEPSQLTTGKLLIVDKDKIGGDDKLGEKLMANYFFALTKASTLPAIIQFYHRGVFLCHKNSAILDELKQLVDLGVKIYVCGLCIDFFNIKDEIAVGQVTNMYEIVETQMKMKEVIHL